MPVDENKRKLRKCENNWYSFFCPGCNGMHAIPVKPNEKGWEFNNNLENPTFSPSILITGVQSITDEEAERILAGEPFEPKPRRCHSFVIDGKIKYLTDCSHALAGQTINMKYV